MTRNWTARRKPPPSEEEWEWPEDEHEEEESEILNESECDFDLDEHEPSLHEEVPETRKKSSKTPSATSSKAYDKHSWWDEDWNSWGSNWWGTGNGQWTWHKDRGEY
jgi:hypothetical protein